MISFILGLSFMFEAAALAVAEPFIIKRIIFNGVSPGLVVYVGIFSIAFFILAQLCFFLTRNKYGYDSIFEHPFFGRKKEEEEKEPVIEGMIEGREIAEINRGEIVFATQEADSSDEEDEIPEEEVSEAEEEEEFIVGEDDGKNGEPDVIELSGPVEEIKETEEEMTEI